jgi:hypothetical protein
MGALESLLQAAKAGKFKSNRPAISTSPITAVSPATPTKLTPGLSEALDALTAAERALCSPAIVAALVAELPTRTDWATWPIELRRNWVAERLGLAPSRFWHITRNGRRWFVEFAEPQTATALQEQAARNRPGETITLQPALRFAALPDNAIQPVDNSENVKGNPDMQQATLLPDNAVTGHSGPAVATVSAAELLTGAGVAVRYLVEPGQAEQALSELATLPDTGPWGLDIETMPLPAFRTDSKAGLDPWRSAIRLVQVYPGGATCYVFDTAALGLSHLRELLQARAFVAHNALFELKFLLHNGAAPGKLGCTLLQDNALGGGRRSLAALSLERLKWALDKALQVSDWTAANLTAAQLDYAALDAVAAYRLAGLQAALLKERGLVRCYALMRDAQPAIARLELAGCPFDTAAHTALIAQWQSTAEQARGELDSLLNGANPDSPLQLSKWLSANLPAETLAAWPNRNRATANRRGRPGGFDPSRPGTLGAVQTASRGCPPTARGMQRTYPQLPGAYTPVSPWAEPQPGGCPVQPRTFKTRPATRHSGRYSHPQWRALPGGCRLWANRTAGCGAGIGRPAMLAVYEQGEDLHRKTAAAFLGKEPEAVSKAERQIAKGINFGMLFGSGAKGLASLLQKQLRG